MGVKPPLLLCTLFILNVNNKTVQGENTTKVEFVNLVYRHGARTPFLLYPTDPHKDAFATLWPEGRGQLTNLGKRQSFQLGQWLRQRYAALLTDRYSPDIIYVQSTDTDRTLMSAECVLAGMFPPAGVQVWSDDLAWQPIPVHTTPRKADKVLSQPPKVPCPAYNQELQKVFTSSGKVRALNQTYSDLLRWTFENSGIKYTLESIGYMCDMLSIESSSNLTLPKWTKRVFPEPMEEATVISLRLYTWTKTLTRLKTGLLLQDMINHMEDKVHSKTTRTVHAYSAHDYTILSLMVALGAFNDILPPYAACLMMELHRDSRGDYYVSLLYRNSTSEEPYLLTIQGCEPQCPLDKFIALSQPSIPDDWDKECELQKQSSFPILITVTILVAIAILVVVAVVGAVAFLKWKKSARSLSQSTSLTQETSQNATNPAPTSDNA